MSAAITYDRLWRLASEYDRLSKNRSATEFVRFVSEEIVPRQRLNYQEVDYVRRNYETEKVCDIARKLGRSERVIARTARRLGMEAKKGGAPRKMDRDIYATMW